MSVIEPNAVYSIEQVAGALGLKSGAVRKWVREGVVIGDKRCKLPASKPGKSYIVRGSVLLEWLSVLEGVSPAGAQHDVYVQPELEHEPEPEPQHKLVKGKVRVRKNEPKVQMSGRMEPRVIGL